MISAPLLLAQAPGQPMFGNLWLTLLAVLAGVAVFMVLIAFVGRWLAATHPTEAKAAAKGAAAPAAPAVAKSSTPNPEIIAVIAGAIAAELGSQARITAIRTVAPNIEMLMQQWSLEGRRQIYTSHQVR